VLSVAVAFLIEYFDDTLKAKEDISRVLEVSTIGEIGALRNKNDRLVTVSEPRSANAEAYRILRTNISFSSIDKPIKTILITSASPGEGKSVTAANLAATTAQAGYRTLLLDCDLRQPTQHKVFNTSNDVGLTNSLLAHANLQSFVRNSRVENLSLLTTGPLPPNPAELLGSRSMANLLTALQGEFDIVVVDSPPVLAVADAAILSRMSDGVLLVVDSGKTRRDPAARALESLQQGGARVLGVVINRIRARASYYAYNSRYYTSGPEKSQSRSTPATTGTS
jgi:capsular exopolysaccharide synthesis family protein